MALHPPQSFRRTEYIHRRGLAADKPAANDVLPGTLYFSYDTGELQRSDGVTWFQYSSAGSGVEGPQGPQGVPGATGPAGPQGIQGVQGDPGPTGATGSVGPIGPQGPEGPQGIQGIQGIPGDDGADGAQGIQGPVGPVGPAGADGADGEQGPPGISTSVFPYRVDLTTTSVSDPGAGRVRFNDVDQEASTILVFDWLTVDGFDAHELFILADIQDHIIIQDTDLAVNRQIWRLTGPGVNMPDWFYVPVELIESNTTFSHNQHVTVLVNYQGSPGPPGPQGIQGETGAQGIPGPQGIQGVKGDTGDTGPQGPIGNTGAQGATGPIGATGPKGDTGNTGAQGIQGLQGPIGPQGPAGTDGAQGPQGIQGIKGDTGNTGAQGIQGPTGPQGIQGPIGPQGPPGEGGGGGGVAAIIAVFDGGDLVVSEKTVYVRVPFACTITGWVIVGDVVGYAIVDIYKSTFAGYPPTISSWITGSQTQRPELHTQIKDEDFALTTWSTLSIAAGDFIAFALLDATDCRWLSVELVVTKV